MNKSKILFLYLTLFPHKLFHIFSVQNHAGIICVYTYVQALKRVCVCGHTSFFCVHVGMHVGFFCVLVVMVSRLYLYAWVCAGTQALCVCMHRQAPRFYDCEGLKVLSVYACWSGMPDLSGCLQMYVFLCLQKFYLCACMASIISVWVCIQSHFGKCLFI